MAKRLIISFLFFIFLVVLGFVLLKRPMAIPIVIVAFLIMMEANRLWDYFVKTRKSQKADFLDRYKF